MYRNCEETEGTMKNLFTRKRNSGHPGLMHQYDYPHQGSSAINPNPGIFSSDWGQEPADRYDWAIDPSYQQENRRTGGMGKLVSKLSCSSNKRELRAERTRDKQFGSTTWGYNPPRPMDDETITRPVLITVKDGEPSHQEDGSFPDHSQPENSFVVGERQRSSSSRFGLGSLRKVSRSFSAVSPTRRTPPRRTPPRVSFGGTTSRSPSREMDDVLTSRELARKQRWRRGIERSWKDDADVPSLTSGDDSAISGSYASGASVDTDYTTEASSEDSRGYSPSNRAGKQYRSRNRGYAGTSPPRYDTHGRLRKASNKDLWSGVAEDMGILAGMLLSDGTACVGSVAAITHETVVDSCHSEIR